MRFYQKTFSLYLFAQNWERFGRFKQVLHMNLSIWKFTGSGNSMLEFQLCIL